MNVLAVIKLVDIVLFLAEKGTEMYARAQALRADLQVFVDEKRDPTTEEWAALDAQTDQFMSHLDQRAQEAQEFKDSQGR